MAVTSRLLVYSYNKHILLLKLTEANNKPPSKSTAFLQSAPSLPKKTIMQATTNPLEEITLALLQNTSSPKLGDIYYSQITKYQKNLDCYFLDLGNNHYALLKNNKQTKSLLKNPHIGQKILVVITKEGEDSKYPVASLNITFNGLYTIFAPFSNATNFSNPIDDNNKKLITKALNNAFGSALGVTIKNHTNIDHLVTEINLKKLFWEKLNKNLPSKIGLVYSFSIILNAIFMDSFNTPEKVELNSLTLLATIKNELTTFLPFVKLDLIYNNLTTTYINYCSKLEEEFNNQININNEIILQLYNTKALTFIDIDFKANNASNTALGKKEALFKANLAVIPYIAKLIKLRNIAGQIFIDTLKLKNKLQQDLVLQQYKTTFATNNLQANILGFTKLGILEIERPKTITSLSGQFFNNCNFCGGGGKVVNYTFLNLKALLQLTQILEVNPLASITIKSSAANLEQFKANNLATINKLITNNKINFISDNQINHQILVY